MGKSVLGKSAAAGGETDSAVDATRLTREGARVGKACSQCRDAPGDPTKARHCAPFDNMAGPRQGVMAKTTEGAQPEPDLLEPTWLRNTPADCSFIHAE